MYKSSAHLSRFPSGADRSIGAGQLDSWHSLPSVSSFPLLPLTFRSCFRRVCPGEQSVVRGVVLLAALTATETRQAL